MALSSVNIEQLDVSFTVFCETNVVFVEGERSTLFIGDQQC